MAKAEVLKTCLKVERKMVNFKASEDEIKEMVKRAEKYCKGNLTAWLIYSATNHIPDKNDLTTVQNVRPRKRSPR